MQRYGLLYIWKSTQSITPVYITDATHLLLACKQLINNQYIVNGYGGKCMNNESIQQCIVRECNEECGLHVTIDQLQSAGIIHQKFINTTNNNDSTDTIIAPHTREIHIYTTNQYNGTLIDTIEMKSHKWYSINELSTLYEHMWPSDSLWLHHVLYNKYVTGTITLNNFKLIDHNIVAHQR